MYQTHKDIPKVKLSTGPIVIVTGWTQPKSIVAKLDPTHCAAVGPAYFQDRSLELIIRNLLLNPQVTTVITLEWLDLDRNWGASTALHQFFTQGFIKAKNNVGKECYQIIGYPKATIPIDISEVALTELRQSVQAYHLSGRKNISALQELVHNAFYEPCSQTRNKYNFPMLEFDTNDLALTAGQAPRYYCRDIADAWLQAVYTVFEGGSLVEKETEDSIREVLDLSLILPPLDPNWEPPSWFLNDKQQLIAYGSSLLDSNCPNDTAYTYGSRITNYNNCNQLEKVVQRLQQEPTSMRAFVSLWAPITDSISSSPPCLTTLWFAIRNNQLVATCFFRSNDMYSAFPTNCYGIQYLQTWVATQLEIPVGNLTYHIASAHIYSSCWEDSRYLLQYRKQNKEYYTDSSGSFLIELVDSKIQMTYITPTGADGWVDTGSCSYFMRELIHKFPWLTAEHTMYLGAELTKAAAALANGTPYEQG